MRRKQRKKWIILSVVAGLLISQLVTRTVWAAEPPDAEVALEETVTESAGSIGPETDFLFLGFGI